MLRILHVIGSMDCGGAETMLMNLYRDIDRTKIQFDFMVHKSDENFYETEIKSLGGKIYRMKRFNVINIINYFYFWMKFFKIHPEYQIVHGHINSSAFIYLLCAKSANRFAIIHSHATKNIEKTIRSKVFQICSYPNRFIADYFFACSWRAGKDRFGMKIINSHKFCVLFNGINVEEFSYDEKLRYKTRKAFEISRDTLLVGHVGRFTIAKNHQFLIQVFREIHDRNSNSMLWLVGTGELEDEIRRMIADIDLTDAVRFCGLSNNVVQYLQAMDVFIFPSFYEGFGIALVEAQAVGLPCIASENIQQEADVGAGLLKILNLSDTIIRWADSAMEATKSKRGNSIKYINMENYDIKNISLFLQKFYLKI